MLDKDNHPDVVRTNGEDRHQVDLALDDVLHSGSFNASKQCQTLLRYLVGKAQDSNEETLKERSIGIEVFNRGLDYDTANDPIARARVGEVRKRLAQYYQSEEGKHAKIQMTIPQGSYRVIFRPGPEHSLDSHDQPLGLSSAALTQHPLEPSGRVFAESKKLSYWAIGALCLVAVLVVLNRGNRPEDAADKFWAPLFQSSQPVLVYTGTNLIFSPTRKLRAKLLLDPRAVGPSPGKIPYLSALTSGDVLTMDDVHPSNYEYTTIGDMAAGMKLAAFLTLRKRSFELRAGDNISIGDLRNAPAVLIGASNNPWTLELTQNLPITLGITPDGGSFIQDTGSEGSIWRQRLNSSASDGEDYGLVARLLSPETGTPVIIVAGLTSFATRAAGQFVSDPAALREFTKTAPKGWAGKNLVILLQTRVLKSDSGAARVVTARYW